MLGTSKTPIIVAIKIDNQERMLRISRLNHAIIRDPQADSLDEKLMELKEH